MIQDMLVLVGVGFFMKAFFDSAKRIKQTTNSEDQRKKLLNISIHIGLGLAFIVVARLYVMF